MVFRFRLGHGSAVNWLDTSNDLDFVREVGAIGNVRMLA